MKALSLIQPWASLVASGAKRWETRSWRANYRGPLAIHASAAMPISARDLIDQHPFRWRLAAGLACRPGDIALALPRGAVIGITWLEDVVRTEDIRDDLDEEEIAFGNFGDGRYAWRLREPESFAPVCWRGHLGLWDLPDDAIPEPYRLAIRHAGSA